jgi:long-chain acyl-CoA synthetase
MLSHGNLTSNALAAMKAFGIEQADLKLGWLPLSHIFARTSDLYTWLGGNHELALAESRETLLADCAAVRPTMMNGVPYFYDKVHRYLREQGLADTPGALKQMLGGRIRLCCSGGAALADHVAVFFQQQGVPLVQGYGLTETSPVITVGSASNNRIGTVGQAIADVEVRIAEDGEILTRGPHVMQGYWNKPAATAEVLRNGWLHTGDLGTLDDGYLRITGRKKELLVTTGGKNIAPVYLEGLLTEDALISQAMIVGDGRNYLTALVVPDRQALAAEVQRRGLATASSSSALASPEVNQLYADCIQRRLADVARCEQVCKFTLLDRAFTIETGELTPTLKLRRGVILQNFSREIQAMYEGERR